MIETIDMYGDRLWYDMTTRRTDFYFARREIPRLESDIIETQYELWRRADMLHACDMQAKRAKHAKYLCWPRNDDECVGFGTCPYFNLCTTGCDFDSGILPIGYQQLENVHTELTDQ